MGKSSIKTKKRSIQVTGELKKDELLFQEIKATFRLDTLGQLFNILLVMKNIKPGAYITPHPKLKQTMLTFFEKYKLHYQIYNGFRPDTLRCFVSTKPITHNLIIKNKLQHLEIGKFLGYECPGDFNNKTVPKIFISIDMGYSKPGKTNRIREQIYGFVCNSVSDSMLAKLELKARQITKLGNNLPHLMPNFFCGIRGEFQIYGKSHEY